MKKTKSTRRRKGQTIVEYILIIAIVVVAAIGLLGIFSDTVRSKIAGITNTIDSNADASSTDENALDIMKDLEDEGYSPSQ